MRVIDNFLGDQELEYVCMQFNECLQKEWLINKFNWQEQLTIGIDGHVLMQYAPEKVKNIVCEALKKNDVQFDDNIGIMYYIWTIGSGINWHHDDHVKLACTLYLDDWPIDYGGQLVYKEGRANKLVPVRQNRLVINEDNTEHMVSLVKKHSDRIRFTMQIFIK